MLMLGLLLPIVFISCTEGSWYKDVISPEGWHFGEGMVFHIEDTKAKNSSFFDRIALRVDYGEVEVSAVPKPEKEAVQLDFSVKKQQEGRGNKQTMGNMVIPFWLGTAKGTAMTMLLTGMKLIALKSLLLAKVAVIVSIVLVASKFFKKSEPYYVEMEQTAGSQHYPVYDYPAAPDTADHQQVYAYTPYQAAYAPSAAEATGHYATVVDANGAENETTAAKQQQVQPHFVPVSSAAKRRDHLKKKFIPSATVLTIKHYNRPESLI